jgi:hypothetical protein
MLEKGKKYLEQIAEKFNHRREKVDQEKKSEQVAQQRAHEAVKLFAHAKHQEESVSFPANNFNTFDLREQSGDPPTIIRVSMDLFPENSDKKSRDKSSGYSWYVIAADDLGNNCVYKIWPDPGFSNFADPQLRYKERFVLIPHSTPDAPFLIEDTNTAITRQLPFEEYEEVQKVDVMTGGLTEKKKSPVKYHGWSLRERLLGMPEPQRA